MAVHGDEKLVQWDGAGTWASRGRRVPPHEDSPGPEHTNGSKWMEDGGWRSNAQVASPGDATEDGGRVGEGMAPSTRLRVSEARKWN